MVTQLLGIYAINTKYLTCIYRKCMHIWNSPIVRAVLASDSWNYCSGEQARQSNICKIPQSSLYSWTMYINKRIRCCHLMQIPLATRWHMLGIPLPLNQWSHAWQTLRRSLVEAWYSLEQYIGLKEDKLSSTTVDFIRSEGNLETKHLYCFRKPKMC